MIAAMSRNRTEHGAGDPFSTERLGDTSAQRASKVIAGGLSRTILPRDLTKALMYLDDQEFDRLFRATKEEAERRGRIPSSSKTPRARTVVDPDRSAKLRAAEAQPALTQGQVNAVRASFKAGVRPSQIARQFGLSQSDVRWALAEKISKSDPR
jgi:hypothetical protein